MAALAAGTAGKSLPSPQNGQYGSGLCGTAGRDRWFLPAAIRDLSAELELARR